MNISPEIISAILTFVGTVILAFITFQLSIRRGNNIVLRKVKETSLVDLSRFSSNDFSIVFGEKKFEKLKLYELELANEGFENITEFESKLIIYPQKNNSFVKLDANDYVEKISITEQVSETSNSNEKYYFLKRPYFKTLKKDKSEKVFINVFSDSELNFKVIGGGKDWNLIFRKSTKSDEIILPTFKYSLIIVLFGGFLLIIENFFRSEFIEIAGSSLTCLGIIPLVIIPLITEISSWRKKRKTN